MDETVRKCYTPVEKVCNGQGPEECRIVHQASCTTKYVEKQPGKFVGDSKCEKLPVEICGAGCVFEEVGWWCWVTNRSGWLLELLTELINRLNHGHTRKYFETDKSRK